MRRALSLILSAFLLEGLIFMDVASISELESEIDTLYSAASNYKIIFPEAFAALSDRGSLPESFTPDVVTNGSEAYADLPAPDATVVSVKIVWKDMNNRSKHRPKKIVIRLYANGSPVGRSIALFAKHKWKGAFRNLLPYKNGKWVKYTIHAPEVSHYKLKISGNSITGFTVKYVVREYHHADHSHTHENHRVRVVRTGRAVLPEEHEEEEEVLEEVKNKRARWRRRAFNADAKLIVSLIALAAGVAVALKLLN